MCSPDVRNATAISAGQLFVRRYSLRLFRRHWMKRAGTRPRPSGALKALRHDVWLDGMLLDANAGNGRGDLPDAFRTAAHRGQGREMPRAMAAYLPAGAADAQPNAEGVRPSFDRHATVSMTCGPALRRNPIATPSIRSSYQAGRARRARLGDERAAPHGGHYQFSNTSAKATTGSYSSSGAAVGFARGVGALARRLGGAPSRLDRLASRPCSLHHPNRLACPHDCSIRRGDQAHHETDRPTLPRSPFSVEQPSALDTYDSAPPAEPRRACAETIRPADERTVRAVQPTCTHARAIVLVGRATGPSAESTVLLCSSTDPRGDATHPHDRASALRARTTLPRCL